MPRTVRLWSALSMIVALSGIACAETFPSRPVTLVVPFPPGGSTDVVMRSLGSATEKYLGQTIVIENRAGANGVSAPVQMAATAAPDGYTISQVNRLVFRHPFVVKTTFDPAIDLTYIIGITGYTFGVVVRADAPWKTFEECLAAAGRQPMPLTFGTTGAGSSQHIIMEQLARQRGFKWTHIPFKGDADMLNALLGGHIDVVAGSTTWGPLVDAGKFRLLVTFGANRTKSWPNVPTLKDIGIDMVMTAPFGLAGPKGMAPEIVKTLHDAFSRGMQEPSFLTTLARFDQEIWYRSSEDYRAYVVREIPEQKRIVDEFGLGPK